MEDPCPACNRPLDSDPRECLLVDHCDFWRSRAEQAQGEVRNLQKALDAAMGRLKQIQSSYSAGKCPKCGEIFQFVVHP